LSEQRAPARVREATKGLHQPEVSCLVATTPRSGSWLLSAALQDTGLVGVPEEYFRPDMIRIWSDQWGISRRAPYGVFVRHALDYGTTDNGVFSAKLHWYQLEWFVEQLRPLRGGSMADLTDGDLIAAWLPDPHYVHLHRRDRARQAISYFRAGRSGVWFVQTGDDPPQTREETERDTEPPSEAEWQHVRWLEGFVRTHDRNWRDFFRAHEIQPLDVAYEDLVADFQGTLAGVLEFLGAGSATDVGAVSPRLARQSDELSEVWLEEYLAKRDRITPKQLTRAVTRPGRS
jgi:trehalose 2-sulfotransferase